MNLREKSLEYANNNFDHFVENLKEIIRIPSVSTDHEHKPDMLLAANWLKSQMDAIGLINTQILPTKGHPVVFGESRTIRPDVPTVLIYGHYDVQPAEPLDLWESNPFIPEKRADYLFGRGASDMKGQIIVCLSAIESILQFGELPLNLKFMIEGEEEIGSPHLAAFLEDHKDLLQCDVVLNPDAGMIGPDFPTIVYALRGLAYFEIRVTGPSHDLHSGLFGGIVKNPAIALSELIAGMHDKDGKILLPGFYDTVDLLSSEERDQLARLPISDETLLSQTGVKELFGEQGFTSIERVGARPTLDVNGLYSGFTASGSKTIIPSWAMAKVSMRLVPQQTPEDVYTQLVQYMEENAPKSIQWEITKMSGGPASIANRNHPGAIALSDALETVWGKKPLYKREGGSIPIVADMQKILGVDSVLTGFGLPDDNIHAPNEKLHLPTWKNGVLAIINFLFNYSGN
jgi:acetylornithine deacetylase/succinyl-diaminopimelate desuccinylase-like protein